MAPIRCDLCSELEAEVLVGSLTDGRQQALCGPDLARWGLELAVQVLPPEEVMGVIQRHLASLQEGPPANGAPKRSRAKKAAARAEPEPEPAPAQEVEAHKAAPEDS